MVIMLGVLIIGGAVWFVRRQAASRPPLADRQTVPISAARSLAPHPVAAAALDFGRIEVSGLTKQYPGVTAVQDLTFVVEPGSVTGFLGPNGSGKTTTLRMILGLVAPTAGTVTIGGARYADLAEPVRRVGGLLDASAAHAGRTGRDHLRIICRAAGLPASRADEVLGVVGLTAAGRRKFREYSLGMRQRLGVAAALLGDPQVLILDEPANGLDPEGIRWMRGLLRALADAGRTILLSSHQLAEMELLADDLIIIAGGRLVAHGGTAAVTSSLCGAGRTLVRTPEAAQLAAELGAAAVLTPGADGDVYVMGVDAVAIGDAARRLGIPLYQLVSERRDLEAAFLELTACTAAIR
ncbi:MAG TPA: ABC transporter ATP-binding protein [Streptosporangiaceae bacterium]|jgi:ABC-2 type transport system ATP-binding protein